MPQDRNSGAAGDRYGREYGNKIARALGAQKLSKASNECVLDGERVVIKCRRKGRIQSVGVTYLMLERLAAVIGAFEEADGSYSVVSLPGERFRAAMTPTRTRGASAGRVWVVKRVVLDREGKLIRVLRLN
jgi:hypothetical protein